MTKRAIGQAALSFLERDDGRRRGLPDSDGAPRGRGGAGGDFNLKAARDGGGGGLDAAQDGGGRRARRRAGGGGDGEVLGGGGGPACGRPGRRRRENELPRLRGSESVRNDSDAADTTRINRKILQKELSDT
jgi:hypothetical protein